jgi:hypothetical protein
MEKLDPIRKAWRILKLDDKSENFINDNTPPNLLIPRREIEDPTVRLSVKEKSISALTLRAIEKLEPRRALVLRESVEAHKLASKLLTKPALFITALMDTADPS